MKYITKIENISEIYSLSNDLYFVKDGNLMDLNFKKIIGLLNSNCVVDRTLYSNTSKELYYFDTDNNEFILISNLETEVNFFEPISKNEFIASIGDDENEILIKYSKNEIIWNIPYSPAYYHLLSKNIFLLRDNFNTKNITRIDLKTGFPLWSYSLPEGFKIFGAPEIIDNVVYILAYTSHFQESHRIGLEIETGNKIWEISGGVDKNTTPIYAKTFNPKDKLLYGLYKTFQVFNPKTGKLLVNKIIEKANEDHFDAYSKAIYDDKLWFVSGKYENCKFGYISLKTNEIELLQDFPQENDEQFSKPIFHEGKLYLKGVYYNNLYIFEE